MIAARQTVKGWYPRHIRIRCDNCEAEEEVLGTVVATARRELKEKGWSSRRIQGCPVRDYCPQCTQITQMYKRRTRRAN